MFILPQQRGVLFFGLSGGRFPLFFLKRRMLLLLALDSWCNTDGLGCDRRSHHAARIQQSCGSEECEASHRSNRSNAVIRCSTCRRAVPPVCRLRSIAAETVNRAKTPFSIRSEHDRSSSNERSVNSRP